jgi:hypothetical protein
MDSYPSCTNGECSHGLAYPLVAVKFKKVESKINFLPHKSRKILT